MLKEYAGMPIMSYEEQENFKLNATTETGRRWGRFHRFIEDTLHKSEPQVFVKGFHPTFREYCSWMNKFPGWSYGVVTSRNHIWNDCGKLGELPMNKFYKMAQKRRGEIRRQNAKKRALG